MSRPSDDEDDDHDEEESESPADDEHSSSSLDDQLTELSANLAPSDSDLLEALGRYSIYGNESARMMTMPVGAEGFGPATWVQQFYVDGEQPMLIVLPVER